MFFDTGKINEAENTVHYSKTSFLNKLKLCQLWCNPCGDLNSKNNIMTAGLELRKLKADISTFECLNYQELKYFTHKITRHIRLIFETHPVKDAFLNNYIESVVIKHIEIIEDYVDNLNDYKGKESFVSKALKYHFNCITDSFTYASLIHQHQ